MYLKSIELSGFKSFAKKDVLSFKSPISGIVGPNGSGKSNIAESFRFVLGEQSMKSMRGKRGEDLIFNGSPSASRSNRASVKVIFDNTERFLDVDFDEVSIERIVHRDGVNQYAINGSNVRLRDVIELLAAANIGSSGHHIISQGEADRILNANIKERREIIEDALGLKVYQYKKQESQKKLTKTEENIGQVESLRKEVAPHLRFLERQVKKVEKTLAMRDELKVLYAEYLRREFEYIKYQKEYIEREKTPLVEQFSKLENELANAKSILESSEKGDEKSREIVDLEGNISQVRNEKDVLSREIGRIEGQISFEERRLKSEKDKLEKDGNKLIPLKDVEDLALRVEQNIKEAEDIDSLKKALKWVLDVIKEFVSAKKDTVDASVLSEEELNKLRSTKEKLDSDFSGLLENEEKLHEQYEGLRKEIDEVKDESREAEREVFRIMSEQNVVQNKLNSVKSIESRIAIEDEDLKREITEAGVLIGMEIAKFKEFEILGNDGEKLDSTTIATEERSNQVERRREVEKIKIRLEDVGGGSADEIMNEYKEVKDRDEFFEKELADLSSSAQSLQELIQDLEEKLDIKFKEGVTKINGAFQEFFELLFDGGTAKLDVVKQEKKKKVSDEDGEIIEIEEDPEEKVYEGIEVKVNLPRKRISNLDMLSGGERALTSIALLFAMSQVNPPPFIILDETDAALDEANSRKYGDMVTSLSEKSQLILITHNRETMSRAGILYGITMGGDGISRVLSVQLDEAMQVAK